MVGRLNEENAICVHGVGTSQYLNKLYTQIMTKASTAEHDGEAWDY
jgi:hypothetical protein